MNRFVDFTFRPWRMLAVLMLGLVYVVAVILPPLLVGVGNVAIKVHALRSSPPAFTQALPAPPAHDPNKRTAVVLASTHGTEISDFLPPYEILAASGAFNVYAVAPERRAIPLTSALHLPSGVDIVPHYSFEEYDQAFASAPDLIVIPVFSGYNPTKDASILAWIRAHAGERTTILTICAATEVLADTGLLDGHAATTFHRSITRYESRYPNVRWIRGVRWVDDGNIISSSSLTAGIDATLHTLERMVGRHVAEDVARKLNYSHLRYLDDPRFEPPTQFALGALPSAAYRWAQTDVGVVLAEGVSELALAAVLDPYAVSLAKTHTLAPERTIIRSKHGLSLVPGWDFRTAPALDHLFVLEGGSARTMAAAIERWSQERQSPRAEPLPEHGAFAYDVTLRAIAQRQGGAVAAAAGSNLVYPTVRLDLPGSAWSLDLLIPPMALGLLGLGLAVGVRRRRAGRQRGVGAAPAHPVPLSS